MSDVLVEHLKNKIEQNKVIIFIGAGASLDVLDTKNNRVFPDWSGLLKQIAKLATKNGLSKGSGLEASIDVFDTKMLLEMVKSIKSELPGDVWRAFLRDTFSIKEENINEESLSNFQLISKINTPLTITTNYDPVYQIATKNQIKVWTHKNSAEVHDLINGDLENNAIWHIHGHIDEVNSLILCSGDYEHFYQNENSEQSYKHL